MFSVLDRLWSRATSQAPLFTLVDDDGVGESSLSHAQTLEAGAAVARTLQDVLGVRPGEPVMLVFPPSLEFVAALVGCLMARAIAVPVAPPDPLRPGAEVDRLARACRDCGARVALTSVAYQRARQLGRLRGLVVRPQAAWPELVWRTVSAATRGRAARPPAVEADEVAVLQYTSGSTAEPKGVRITHGNLEHQLGCNAEDLGLSAASRSVLWVPHFHDFGLISGIMSALHGNGRLWLLSPLAFVRRPAVWFDVMARVRATHTAAPNFAYELAVRKTTPEQRRGWDLSALAVAMCAAEPIVPRTMRAFLAAFAASGLRPSAFCPAYGLAEHTVGVTVGGTGVARVSRAGLARGVVAPPCDDRDAHELVGCGRPSRGVEVRIVDPERMVAVADGVVGEIWVDSPSKARGYLGRDAETRETFAAPLAGEGRWLRTGDLGFIQGGELFPCGRRKDLLILRGRNVYPQDLEETARQAHPAVRPGGVVAFAIDRGAEDGGEALVLVVEVAKGAEHEAVAVAQAIRERVLEHHGVGAHAVAVVRAGGVPRTTSGKPRRQSARAAYLRGDAATLHVRRFEDLAPASAAEQGAGEDPRLIDEPSFREAVSALVGAFEAMTRARGGRVFHRRATTLAGTLIVEAGATALHHPRFSPGRRYPVIVRHANGVQDDDAAIDNRGATVRVLEEGRGDDLEDGWLDLLLTTGPCFLAATAEAFAAWIGASAAERLAIAAREPHRAEAAWGMFRAAESFAALHYHAKTANRARGGDGGERLIRFRLVPLREEEGDPGRVPVEGPLPPEVFARRAGDVRARTCLHDELRRRVTGGVGWRLQVQRREVSDAALDCTRPWPEASFPWTTVARLELDRVVDDARVDRLRFDVFRAPEELRPPLARSARDPASLAHARSLVYEAVGRLRVGAPLPAGLAAWLGRGEPRRIAVIGGGPAGLAAARRLVALGLRVTVFEGAAAVAGKCASITVDGHVFDLGGHVCTPRYTRVAALARALGVAIVPATPTLVFSAETRAIVPRGDRDDVRGQLLAYQGVRARQFPAIGEPGLAHSARALAEGAPTWFSRQEMAALGAEVGVNYAACGYRRVAEDDLPALYPIKGAEIAGLLGPGGDPSLPPAWTVEGGFGAFWARVAAGLADVRTGARVTGVERGEDGVRVRCGGAVERFDGVVLAVPAEEVLALLSDATADERAVFEPVRTVDYRTLVVRARGLPTEGFYLVREACEDPRATGRVVAFHHRHPGSDVVLVYAYGDPSRADGALEDEVAEDLRRLGGELTEVLLHRRWRYFPHVAPEVLRAGYFDVAERIQGARRAWFVGSLFAFELIECNVAFAERLIDAHFGGMDAPRDMSSAEAAGDLRARVAAADPAAREQVVLAYLQELLVRELQLAAPPRADARFPELGLDSIRSVEVFQRVVGDTGLTLAPMIFFDHPSVGALARHLVGELAAAGPGAARSEPHVRTADVVFDDVHGLAGVFDVFTPTGPANGLAVLDLVSVTWTSGRDAVQNHQLLGTPDVLCERGFTVFAVRTGSLSRFDGVDMETTARAAIRHVRREASRYGIDPERIGLLGGSAGGHLAALVGAGVDPLLARDDADVQAVALFCPPTDLRHARGPDHDERACVRCRVAHRGGTVHLDDAARDEALARVSPVCRVERRPPPPVLLFHAERDHAVPFDHATRFVAALRAAGGEARLVARDSDRHPWPDLYKDLVEVAEWFAATLADASPRAREVPMPWLAALASPYREDATLPADVRPARPRDAHHGAVLLTGATGFLGVHLLAELLRDGDGRVLCLVRARDARQGFDRVRDALRRARLWDDAWAGRIEAIAGDLAEPRFRLDGPAFEALAHRIDAVWHAGAVVQFGVAYEVLRAINVGGTREAVRLAALAGVPLQYVSSLAIFPPEPRPTEADVACEPEALAVGYGRTKVVAELLVRAAAERGLAVTIHRPGLISGSTLTGVSNPDDQFARLLGGIADAGVFPRELVGLETSLVPVDRVCAAMVRLAERRGGTFHYFCRGATAFGRVRGLLAARGRPTVLVDWDAFVGAVVERGARSPLAALVEWLRASREVATRLAEVPMAGFDTSATDALLPAGHWPPIDEALLGRYIDDLAARAGLGDRSEPLREAWRARPGRIAGAWQRYDLAWLGRLGVGAPLFPGALAGVAALAGEGVRAAHPYAEFLAALACAHTLAIQRAAPEAAAATGVPALLRQALQAHERLAIPPASTGGAEYGREFEFAGLAGRWLLPAHESAGLLARARDLVPVEALALLERYAARAGHERVADDGALARLFAGESMRLHFGERLPAEALRTEEAREYFERSPHAGATTALAARYLEVTGDPRTRAALERRAAQLDDGLHPAGVGQEAQFALYYLRRAGVDLDAFADEVARVTAAIGPGGVAIDDGGRAPDCDATAVSLTIAHAARVRVPFATAGLERWWNPARRSYQSADERDSYSVSTTVHVLEAVLAAPDVDDDLRARVWARTAALLEERPWVELHHLSPLFIWEKLVAVLGAHARAFPDAPTRAHRVALERVLAAQDPALGGFATAFAGRPNAEETALGLLALRAGLRFEVAPELREALTRAADRAAGWLAAWGEGEAWPDLWVGKLTYAPVLVLRALVAAARTSR